MEKIELALIVSVLISNANDILGDSVTDFLAAQPEENDKKNLADLSFSSDDQTIDRFVDQLGRLTLLKTLAGRINDYHDAANLLVTFGFCDNENKYDMLLSMLTGSASQEMGGGSPEPELPQD